MQILSVHERRRGNEKANEPKINNIFPLVRFAVEIFCDFLRLEFFCLRLIDKT